jgi:alpha-glucosidase
MNSLRDDIGYNAGMQDEFLWWRDGVIYQVYPRSFADSNNDGLGDLPGLVAHLDYIASLGVSAIWLSPFYPSPDKDFGYDISDYTQVDPRFGTLQDFDRLVDSAHRLNIRVVLDLVLNHTSNQHAWFQESSSSRNNPRAGWYIWCDAVPNNWQSVFGGRAWTYSPARRQYYYHMFVREQPDVNWRNPEVRQAQLDVVRFWLERGADGFRLDVFNVYFKDDQLRSNPPGPGIRAFDRQRHIYDVDRPELLPLLRELRTLLDEYPERYAVGETFISEPSKIAAYVGPERLHAAFNFQFTGSPFRPAPLLRSLLDWYDLEKQHGIWPTHVLGNHDVPRPATRYGRGEDDARVRLMMLLLLTQRGTPFLYYGDEIGMRDIRLRRSEILDPPGRKYWPFYKGRDGCRTPMQWDSSQYAGFSSSRPWLPVHPDYMHRNVQAQSDDPDSLLHFTRALIRLRREHPALRRGDFVAMVPDSSGIMMFVRRDPSEQILAALNFTPRRSRVSLPETSGPGSWDLLLSSLPGGSADLHTQSLTLEPYQACLLKRTSS